MLADRLTAQLLSGPPARDPLAVAERLLAIQGQDPRGARLAIRARSKGVSAADVDRALTIERSLLITTLNRGTLHLVRSEDYPWLHMLTAPLSLASCQRRLAEEGVPAAEADRGAGVIAGALEAEGPLTRHQLRERLDAAGVRTAGQALVHLIMLANLRGLAVRGPMLGKEHAFVRVEDWLPRAAPVERGEALARLARRYLAGHGPATAADLARWTGLPLRDARAGLQAISGEIEDRGAGLADLRGRPEAAPLPPPRLLGAFEPALLGWTSREDVVGEHKEIVTTNGIFRPFAMVQGRAVATWSMPAPGRVALVPFSPLEPEVTAALATEAIEVARFLGA